MSKRLLKVRECISFRPGYIAGLCRVVVSRGWVVVAVAVVASILQTAVLCRARSFSFSLFFSLSLCARYYFIFEGSGPYQYSVLR